VRGGFGSPPDRKILRIYAVSAITSSVRIAKRRLPQTSIAAVYNVTDCIKSWGRYGIFWGGILGLMLGAILVAIPLTTDILTFGVIGTLVVASIECAVIAGGFAALAAALFSRGARNHGAAQFEHILLAGRRSAASFPRSIPLSELPSAWTSPIQTPQRPIAQISDGNVSTAFPLPDVRNRLNTIDAWESGNTGP
jgi:hypothetical protein